jgi:uncharacterized protein
MASTDRVTWWALSVYVLALAAAVAVRGGRGGLLAVLKEAAIGGAIGAVAGTIVWCFYLLPNCVRPDHGAHPAQGRNKSSMDRVTWWALVLYALTMAAAVVVRGGRVGLLAVLKEAAIGGGFGAIICAIVWCFYVWPYCLRPYCVPRPRYGVRRRSPADQAEPMAPPVRAEAAAPLAPPVRAPPGVLMADELAEFAALDLLPSTFVAAVRAHFVGVPAHHGFEHAAATAAWARLLLEKEPTDGTEISELPDRGRAVDVVAAAFLHDADDHKLFQTEDQANARRILGQFPGIDAAFVLAAISAVSASANRGSIPLAVAAMPAADRRLALVPRQADRLLGCGWEGVWRTLAYGRGSGRSLATPATALAETEEAAEALGAAFAQRFENYAGDSVSVLDHVWDKLWHLRCELPGNRLAEDEFALRHRAINQFVARAGVHIAEARTTEASTPDPAPAARMMLRALALADEDAVRGVIEERRRLAVLVRAQNAAGPTAGH